jgi:hypothetical protein
MWSRGVQQKMWDMLSLAKEGQGVVVLGTLPARHSGDFKK